MTPEGKWALLPFALALRHQSPNC